MPPFGPISRREFISAMRRAGFAGPEGSGSHQQMVRREKRFPIPNPHGEDIGRPLLVRLLKQANISREEWEKL